MDGRGLLGTVLGAIFVLSTSAATVCGQNDRAPDGAMPGNGDGSVPSSSGTMADASPGTSRRDPGFGQSCCGPRWTASADSIILDRIGSVPYTLVETVPANQSPSHPGTEMLNATDLHQGFSGGPRLDLIHHGDDDGDLEFLYFQIDGWNVCRSVGPTPNEWLVMRAPGDFLQTQDDFLTQRMAWDYSSRLYNAELNARWNPWRRVTVLAGFRWVNLSEELEGVLLPSTSHGTGSFWDAQTKNNLYGFQIGVDAKLLQYNRFSIASVLKAGMFDNHVEEASLVRMTRVQFGDSASTNHLAFLGEIGVQCKYQVTPRLSLKAGYEAIWLQGVALAPGQISKTNCHYALLPQDIYIQSLGVNCNSGVFYHGATAGLEYAF
jgi:hypothetical protein